MGRISRSPFSLRLFAALGVGVFLSAGCTSSPADPDDEAAAAPDLGWSMMPRTAPPTTQTKAMAPPTIVNESPVTTEPFRGGCSQAQSALMAHDWAKHHNPPTGLYFCESDWAAGMSLTLDSEIGYVVARRVNGLWSIAGEVTVDRETASLALRAYAVNDSVAVDASQARQSFVSLGMPSGLIDRLVPAAGASMAEVGPTTTQTVVPTSTASSVLATSTTVAPVPTRVQWCVRDVQGTDVLNVRSGPGVSEPIVTKMPHDSCGITTALSPLSATISSATWVEVIAQVDGRQSAGWVNSRFLTPHPSN